MPVPRASLKSMKTSVRREIFEMSPSERLQLVEELWDSIAAESAAVPVTPEQRQELDRRLTDFERNPDSGDTWDNVKSRIQRCT